MNTNPYYEYLNFAPQNHFGREFELLTLLRGVSLNEPLPYEVHSFPEMGKSSLLQYLFYLLDIEKTIAPIKSEWLSHLHEPFKGDNYHFLFPIYIDFENLRSDLHPFIYLYEGFHNAYSTYRSKKQIISGDNLPDIHQNVTETNPNQLIDQLESEINVLVNLRIRPVFLLDDFDIAFEKPRMTREQTTRLSPLRDRVAFVLATTRRLAKVNPDAAGSPFYQSLMPITLGNLPDSEASEVIRNFLKKMNMPYSKEIIDYIITLTGGHPYLLILTSIAMWDVNSSLKLRSGVTTSSPEAYRYILQGRLKDDFLRSFRIYWELLDDTEQSALKAFVDKEGTSIDKEMLSKLSPLYPKGLVRLGEKTGNYIFFTPLFRDFVKILCVLTKKRG